MSPSINGHNVNSSGDNIDNNNIVMDAINASSATDEGGEEVTLTTVTAARSGDSDSQATSSTIASSSRQLPSLITESSTPIPSPPPPTPPHANLPENLEDNTTGKPPHTKTNDSESLPPPLPPSNREINSHSDLEEEEEGDSQRGIAATDETYDIGESTTATATAATATRTSGDNGKEYGTQGKNKNDGEKKKDSDPFRWLTLQTVDDAREDHARNAPQPYVYEKDEKQGKNKYDGEKKKDADPFRWLELQTVDDAREDHARNAPQPYVYEKDEKQGKNKYDGEKKKDADPFRWLELQTDDARDVPRPAGFLDEEERRKQGRSKDLWGKEDGCPPVHVGGGIGVVRLQREPRMMDENRRGSEEDEGVSRRGVSDTRDTCDMGESTTATATAATRTSGDNDEEHGGPDNGNFNEGPEAPPDTTAVVTATTTVAFEGFLPEATPVSNEGEHPPAEVYDAEPLEQDDRSWWKRNAKAIGFVSFLIIALVVLTVLLVTQLSVKPTPTNEPSSAPPSDAPTMTSPPSFTPSNWPSITSSPSSSPIQSSPPSSIPSITSSPSVRPTTDREATLREYLETEVLTRGASFANMTRDDARYLALEFILNLDRFEISFVDNDHDAARLRERYVTIFLAYTWSASLIIFQLNLQYQDICMWPIVFCNTGTGRVTQITLENENFEIKVEAELPPEIGVFEELEDIFMRGVSLRGQIPTEIGLLKNLKSLRLSHNDLSGQIPTELGQCTDLIHILACNLNLSGEIPTELGRLKSLIQIEIPGSNLSGQIPSEFRYLNSLQILDLESNNLTGYIPTDFFTFPRLNRIYLSGNNVSCHDGDLQCEDWSLDGTATDTYRSPTCGK